jgi:hypothetical protein
MFLSSDAQKLPPQSSSPDDILLLEPRPKVTWDELRTALTHGVSARLPPLPPSHANNLHTMVRAPHNNPVKDKQRSKWMSHASQNAAALLPSLSALLDDERTLELQPLSSTFFLQPNTDPNNLAHILRHSSPLSATLPGASSPSKASPAAPRGAAESISRVLFCDALPAAVLETVRPLFSSSLAGASAPEFIACIGAALKKSRTPTRFYFIVYFETNCDHAVDNIPTSMGRVAAVACYWITAAFDMARWVARPAPHCNGLLRSQRLCGRD